MKRSIKKVFLFASVAMGLVVVLNSCSESEMENGNLGGGLEIKASNQNFEGFEYMDYYEQCAEGVAYEVRSENTGLENTQKAVEPCLSRPISKLQLAIGN
ncbi:MAG TPA: hypothetical protein DDY68_02365 [Porphyromonadaceae bacterium]|nr:hypothetical protein [Porphyromonadaceae bacterium]